MKRPSVRLLSVVCFLLLASSIADDAAHAQRITQFSPSNITFWGVAIVDTTHSMGVGDSALIVFNTRKDTVTGQLVNGKVVPIPIFDSRRSKAPCDSTHTFYAVTYYDVARAVVAGDDGLMFMTSDSGTTWEPSGSGITSQTFRGITHTADGGLVVVGDSGIILRSSDSGVSWKKIVSSQTRAINGISINAAGHGYFVGAHGMIGKTTDFGVSWPIVTDTSAFGYLASGPVTLRSVAICSNDSAVAVGDSGAVGITYDGISWRAMNGFPLSYHAPVSPINISQTSLRAVVYSRMFGYSGSWFMLGDHDLIGVIDDSARSHLDTLMSNPYLFFTRVNRFGDADGGTDDLNFDFNCLTAYGNYGSNVAFGGRFGNQWQGWLNTDTSALFIAPSWFWENFLFESIDSFGYGYAACTGANFLKTTDSGLSWTGVLLESDPFGNGNFDATDIYTIDSNHAIAVGWGGNLYRTSDGGTTWDSTYLSGSNQNRLQSIAHPAEGVYVVAGDAGTILCSTDNAATWKTPFVNTLAYLEAVAFSSPEIGVAAEATARSSEPAIRAKRGLLSITKILHPTSNIVSFRHFQMELTILQPTAPGYGNRRIMGWTGFNSRMLFTRSGWRFIMRILE
jgi:photosystem II stability/assembly factor-like uncharacterized protein